MSLLLRLRLRTLDGWMVPMMWRMYGTSVSRMLSRTCSCNRSPSSFLFFLYNLREREREREIGESQRSVGKVKSQTLTCNEIYKRKREMKFGIGIGRKRTCQGRVWNGLKLIRQFLFSRVRENKYWTKHSAQIYLLQYKKNILD